MTATSLAMTESQAKAILDAFGPCTTTFECTTVDELIADFADVGRRVESDGFAEIHSTGL